MQKMRKNFELGSQVYNSLDLVADLFHLAHRQGTHRDDIIRAANLHFEAEIEEAGEALLPSGILP